MSSNDWSITLAALETGRPVLDKEIFQRMKNTMVNRPFTCLACGEKFPVEMSEWDLFRMENKLGVYMFAEKYGVVADSIRKTGKCHVCAGRR